MLLVASLIRLEFLPHRDKGLMQYVGLAVAMLAFACLAFGQTATKQYAGTASLYTYFGSTVVILILVSLMPPNRSRSLARRQPEPRELARELAGVVVRFEVLERPRRDRQMSARSV